MKPIFKSLLLISFYTAVIVSASFSLTFAEEPNLPSLGPPPPPVDIQFSMGVIHQAGEEVELTIKVTPQEQMHAQISCLLPVGIRPVWEQGLMLRPYKARYPGEFKRQMQYQEELILWVGPLAKGITKNFSFKVIIPDKQRYEFIARVQALAKWGLKEETFAIDIVD